MLKQIVDDIYFVEDTHQARVPYCHCIYVDDDRPTLIDTSSGPEIVEAVNSRRGVKLILTSHYHEDHILNVDSFNGAEVWAHPLDAPGIRSTVKFRELCGFYELNMADIGDMFVQMFPVKDYTVHGEFEDGQIFDTGHYKIQVIHTPGHTAGHCSFLFPEQGLLYTGDIDLTNLGPWYGSLCGDADDFIASINKIKAIDPAIIVSAHLGVIDHDIQKRLDHYLDRFYMREDRLLNTITEPMSLGALAKKYPMYGRPQKPENMYDFFEQMWAAVHLRRLQRLDLVGFEDGVYFKK
ncbi:MAG: MBL fold metallo-hydrolase [Acidobacteriota bacterium]